MRYVDPVALAKARAEIQRMEDEGILTPDPIPSKERHIFYLRMPDDFDLTPYAKETKPHAFLAEINLRLERQKKWPEIEERRRKKLAQIYPSHSEDDDKPPGPMTTLTTDDLISEITDEVSGLPYAQRMPLLPSAPIEQILRRTRRSCQAQIRLAPPRPRLPAPTRRRLGHLAHSRRTRLRKDTHRCRVGPRSSGVQGQPTE